MKLRNWLIGKLGGITIRRPHRRRPKGSIVALNPVSAWRS